MSLSAVDIILDYVVPLIGTGLAITMFLAPVPDVRKNIERGTINDLNPLPWVFMLGNCTGWTLYSILVQDIWLLASNAPGILIAAWLNLGASKLKYQEQFNHMPSVTAKNEEQTLKSVIEGNPEKSFLMEDSHKNSNRPDNGSLLGNTNTDDSEGSVSSDSESLLPGAMRAFAAPIHDNLVMVMASSWLAIVAFVGFATKVPTGTKEVIVGIITNFNLLFFYGAPLSTIAAVLKTRNTASIHVPTMVMNTLTSLFWTIYGFTIFDPFVFIPNGVGTMLGLSQVVLYMVYPRKLDDTPNAIAAQVVIGDLAADAVVVGDPNSDNAVVMINKEDMERLQHSVAIDTDCGGVQVVTRGVPAFAPEEAERIEEEQRKKYGDSTDADNNNNNNNNMDGYVPPPALPPLLKHASSRRMHRATASFGTIQLPENMDLSDPVSMGQNPNNNNDNNGDTTDISNPTSAAGIVPLINISKVRRAGVDVAEIFDMSQQTSTSNVMENADATTGSPPSASPGTTTTPSDIENQHRHEG